MEGFSFVTPVTGLNRPNTGKEDDDDDVVFLKKTDVSEVCPLYLSLHAQDTSLPLSHSLLA
jgi:hypothetical protein